MDPVLVIFFFLFILVFGPGLFVMVQYNGLVTLRNHIRESWANIDTELKRRYELIPNLVETVKGYAAHEKAVLERVMELRNRCMNRSNASPDRQANEKDLVHELQRLLVVVENYPQLKADAHFLKLQRELINTEDRIQAARRFYNGNVRDYRNKCEAFPSNIVAGLFNFPPVEFFEVEAVNRENVSVNLS